MTESNLSEEAEALKMIGNELREIKELLKEFLGLQYEPTRELKAGSLESSESQASLSESP